MLKYTLSDNTRLKNGEICTNGKHGTQSRWCEVPYWKLGKYKEVDCRHRSGKYEA